MHDFLKFFGYLIDNIILYYTVAIISAYVILAIISAFSVVTYMRRNSFIDYNSILASPLAPGVSVIAPAFNESRTIVDNIKALLLLYYPDYEVVIVNDGSTDDSLDKIIAAYDLEKVNFFVNYSLETSL